MQFLVYLTVLMVSVSTVLLEVHWLTSPPPQPKAAIQAASAPVPVPKAEGPSAALSPIYPKKSDTPPPAESNSVQASASNMSARAPETANPVASTQQPARETALKVESPQKSPVETTGVAAREDDARQIATGAINAPNRDNRCDVQACSSAYRSFRASDCTYQPFEGSRRVCEKPPVQRTVRKQRDEPERRKWSKDVEPRDAGRSPRWQTDDDADESEPAFSDDLDWIVVRGFRW
jgi:BA14K-like protein